MLDLEPAGTNEPRHLLASPRVPFDEGAPRLVDATGGVWLVRDEHGTPYGSVFAGDFAAKPTKVGSFDRFLMGAALDPSEVFVARNDMHDCPSRTAHSVIVAFSRTAPRFGAGTPGWRNPR